MSGSRCCANEFDVGSCRHGACMGASEGVGCVRYSWKVGRLERGGSVVYAVEGLLQQCFLTHASPVLCSEEMEVAHRRKFVCLLIYVHCLFVYIPFVSKAAYAYSSDCLGQEWVTRVMEDRCGCRFLGRPLNPPIIKLFKVDLYLMMERSLLKPAPQTGPPWLRSLTPAQDQVFI